MTLWKTHRSWVVCNICHTNAFPPAKHFPDEPIMPGVLIIEALAQTAGILAIQSYGKKDVGVYFLSIDKAKFRKPVVPGDQLRFEVEVKQSRRTVWKLSGKAFVEDTLVCESDFVAMVSEKEMV